MPKLLQITITCNQGSTGKIAEQIGLLMKKKGWEVYLCHGARFVNESQLKTYQIQNVFEEYFHALKSMMFDADGLGSVYATKRLVEYIKQVNPDIIQIHNLHGYYLNFKLLFEYLNSTNIPIVMTLHDCWNMTGHCTHFVTANCDKWKIGCGDCPQIHSVPKSLFIDRSKRNFELKKQYIAYNKNVHFVCVSEWIEGILKQSMYKDHPIHLIKNGVDINTYRPSVAKKNDKFRILGVSNPWSKEKGLYDFFKMREILPIDQYQITLVGLNERQITSLPEGIQGILRTNNQQELVDLYSQSNVFVNPTYADTYPTTNLEALACGTPVVTYCTGGSPESITSEVGVVVEVGDVVGMASVLSKMKDAPLSSEACRNHAETNFDKEKSFEKYLNLYNDLVSIR